MELKEIKGIIAFCIIMGYFVMVFCDIGSSLLDIIVVAIVSFYFGQQKEKENIIVKIKKRKN